MNTNECELIKNAINKAVGAYMARHIKHGLLVEENKRHMAKVKKEIRALVSHELAMCAHAHLGYK